MTIGEFWEKVNALCLRFDGKVISGSRSVNWNAELDSGDYSFHPDGLSADIEFHINEDMDRAAEHAEKLGLWVQKKNLAMHVQPKEP